ncbi:PcfB family protein, partial [Murimonas intestini]
YVKAAVTGTDNFTGVESTKEFTISQATNGWTENLAITGWTYGEKAVSPTAKAIFGNVIFTYSDSEKGAYTDAVPTDAGTWYVKAAVAGTDNYTALEATKEFTISQAANGWTEDLAMTGWTYGEKAVSPTAKAIFGDVIFTYSDSEKGVYTDTVPIDAGTWYVKAAVTGTDNYAGVETTRAFTITPKNIDNNSQIVIPYIKSDKDVENLVIKDGDKELKRGTDYDVNKKQDGSKVTVTITFKGNYTGTVTRTYTVENKKPSDNTDTQKASDTTKNDKNSAVQTGDTTTTGLWAMLMALSAGTAALLKSRKRKKETEE